MTLISVKETVFAATNNVAKMRVYGASETTPITQASLSSIVLKVYSDQDPTTAFVTQTLVVADAIYDTLQTDWDTDTVGYNFAYTLPATTVPTTEVRVRAAFTFTAVTGEVFRSPDFYLKIRP